MVVRMQDRRSECGAREAGDSLVAQGVSLGFAGGSVEPAKRATETHAGPQAISR